MPTVKPLAAALLVLVGTCFVLPDAHAQRRRARSAPPPPPVPEISAECKDFYSATNAAWLAAVPAPPGIASTTALGQLVARSEQQQRDLLDAAMQAPQNDVQKLLGDFWASGLNESAIEADGARPIAPLLDRINAIRRSRDVPAAIAALHQVGIPVVFNFSADIDLSSLDRHIGYFSQGGTVLPDPAFYTRQDPATLELMGHYRVYVEKILTLTGTPAEQLAADTQTIFELETRLAGLARPLESLADARANYAPTPTVGLAKQYRNLRLAEFLAAQGVQDDVVSIADPAMFQQIDALLRSVRPEQWKAYLRYQVGSAMAPYLSKSFRTADFEFRGKLLQGLAAPAPQWKQTLDAINLAAGPMLGREYASRYLPSATRQRAVDVGGHIRDALAQAVQSSWMSETAKNEARSKLAALRIEVGTPARDLDYTIQPMGRGSFGGNMLIASTWRHREEMRRIGRHNAARRWDVLPQQPALTYDPAHNRLIITAAILQSPVLDLAQPAANHYGSLGALVGHELTRAVSQAGRHVDAAGNIRDWWSPADVSHWNTLLARTGSLYARQSWPQLETVKIDGQRVSAQALNDISGLELAARALNLALPSAGDEEQKAFHSAWARLWPQQMSPPATAFFAASSSEPPGLWRSNIPLSQLPTFASTWQCAADAPMSLPEADRFKVW